MTDIAGNRISELYMIKDILYISGTTTGSLANWKHLLQLYPEAHWLNGLKTVPSLLQECRECIHDDFFLLVSSSTRLARRIDNDLPRRLDDHSCYLWQGENLFHQSQQPFAGLLLLPRQILDQPFHPLFPTLSPMLRKLDMMPQKSYGCSIDDSPQNGWKIGFTTALSLTCHLKNNGGREFRMLLDLWCQECAPNDIGRWMNRGAQYGRDFGALYLDSDLNLLNSIDNAWLEKEFQLEQRLYPLSPEMPCPPPCDRYAAFDSALYPTPGKMLYVSTLTKRADLLTPELADLCSFCSSFKTLDQHMESYWQAQSNHILDTLERKPFRAKTLRLISSIRRQADQEGISIPISAKKKKDLQEKLTNLILQGCLVSDHTIKREVLRQLLNDKTHGEPEPPAFISSLSIPTKDRSRLLSLSLESYIKNVCEYGHDLPFTIVDDSDDQDHRQQNLVTLDRLRAQYRNNLVYISQDDRRQYAQRLHQYSGIPLRTINFGLLGNKGYRIKMGAARNTIQLQTLGELNLQMDDDTICRIATATPQGLALTSRIEAKYIFFKDETIWDKIETQPIDWVQQHETYLGKKVISQDILPQNLCFDTQFDITELYPSTYMRLIHNDCRIHLTVLGSFGDSGQGNNSHRLLSKGEAFHQLAADSADYEQLLCSRFLLKAVSRLSLTNLPSCMAMNIGIDNRAAILPFSPVFRNEDAVFAHLLSFCTRNTLIAHLPYAIQHDPQPMRLPSTKEEVINGAAGWGFNDFINAQIDRFQFSSQDVYKNIRLLGECLQEIAEESETSFTAIILDLYRQELLQKLQIVRHRREEQEPSAPQWTNDILRLEHSLEMSLVSSAPPLLHDIPGNMGERIAQSQKLLFEMGALFVHWPEIISAAKDLKEQGISPGHLLAS